MCSANRSGVGTRIVQVVEAGYGCIGFRVREVETLASEQAQILQHRAELGEPGGKFFRPGVGGGGYCRIRQIETLADTTSLLRRRCLYAANP